MLRRACLVRQRVSIGIVRHRYDATIAQEAPHGLDCERRAVLDLGAAVAPRIRFTCQHVCTELGSVRQRVETWHVEVVATIVRHDR
jgi:hypothetical protein